MRTLKIKLLILAGLLALSGIVACSPSSVDSSGAGTITLPGNNTTQIAGISVSANPTTVPAGAPSTITAHVVDSIGAPIANTTVTFSLSDPTKARLSLATAVTNTNGDASVTFTAGSNTATVSVNAAVGTMTGSVSVTISGGLAGGSMTIVANPPALSYNSSSTITVTVKDSSNNPVVGATINFGLNNSSLGLLSNTSMVTNNLGIASITFTSATTAQPAVITATALSLTANVSIAINAPTGNGSLTLNAIPSSIVTFGTSTISATLKDNMNLPIGGVAIDFTLSDGTAGSLSVASALTNSLGVAQTAFAAGNLPTTEVVYGTYTPGGLSNSASITITVPPPASMTVTANPTNILVLGTATISAMVKDSTGNPVPDGTTVTFSLNDPTLGSLSNTFSTTASKNGTATTTFIAGARAGAISITAVAGTVSSSTAVTIAPAQTANISFVSANPQFLGIKTATTSPTSSVTFYVTDLNGNPVDGAPVTFVMNGPGGGAYITGSVVNQQIATSSSVNGNAVVTLHSGNTAGPVTIIASTYVNSGNQTTLPAVGSIGPTDTSITVTSTSGFPNSGLLKIDSEYITYTNISGNTFQNCVRGAIGTTANGHTGGTQVYGQSSISTSAGQMSIGGGVPSAGHFTLTTSVFNVANALDHCGKNATITAFVADRFGNYNILPGTTVNFYAETGSSIYSGSSTQLNSMGQATSVMQSCPGTISDVKNAETGTDADFGALGGYFGGNEPWYPGGLSGYNYNPRDGLVTMVATTMGEELFLDENGDGLFTRSYSNTNCPVGYTCECDGGTTNGYAGCITSQPTGTTKCEKVASCTLSSVGGLRSEGFTDIGEPFYDINDDKRKDDGQTGGYPFESYINQAQNGSYNGPNGLWDGPDCQGNGCQTSKMIWTDIPVSFSASVFSLYPQPDVNNCYSISAPCAGSYDNYPFAVAPTGIVKGSSGGFCAIIGDVNLNSPPKDTVISATAAPGTIPPPSSVTVVDGLSVGPYEFCFNVVIDATETQSSTVVSVSVGGAPPATLSVPLILPSPPAPPSGLSATALPPGTNTIRLKWTPSTGATGYNIYWSTVPGVTPLNGNFISNVTSSPFDHTGRTAGVTYYYVMTAVGVGGESGATPQVSATAQ